MKTFSCRCGNRLFFDNTQCLKCKGSVCFSLAKCQFVTFDDEALKSKKGKSHPCLNYGSGLCNWLADGQDGLCLACRLNVETPVEGENSKLLGNMEMAKRRLLYSLDALHLPIMSQSEKPGGLGFALRRGTEEAPVITGHADGLITLDLNEADPAQRAAIREKLGEDYRTVLGHFRHESGHYYWPLLFPSEKQKARCREVFGDERADYAQALSRHYSSPSLDYENTHISSYATSHPWEDWAESWAHCLHIFDSWETAHAFGLLTSSKVPGPRERGRFSDLLDGWSELMIALNSMNRSMGLDDAYPFSLAPAVREKLCFVADAVHKNAPAIAFK